MRGRISRYSRSQAGYTLVEVVITAAIGAVLLSGLTSVLLTSWRAATTATSRVEASGQIRNFQFFAYDDFARSPMPSANGCVGTSPNRTCTIALGGVQASNSNNPVVAPFPVSYSWDEQSGFLDRLVGTNPPIHAATNVTDFSYYIDVPARTVVISLTVTVQAYAESQTLRFFPRVNP